MDIFFSYSRKDANRVAVFYDVLTSRGFDVFWDQTLPPGVDWDTWIRRHLSQARCAIVFWSATAVSSDNVRHEAQIAKEQEKLVPIFLDALPASRLPMGMYTTQGVELVGWSGSTESQEWQKFEKSLEARLTTKWMQARFAELYDKLKTSEKSINSAKQQVKACESELSHVVEHFRKERSDKLDVVTRLKENQISLEEALKRLEVHEITIRDLKKSLDLESRRRGEVQAELKRFLVSEAEQKEVLGHLRQLMDKLPK